MVGTLIVLGFFAIIIYGELFRAYMPVFLFLWFFLPVVALWLNTQRVRSAFSISSLKIVRGFLIAAVVSLSFVSFSNYNHIRDSVGQRFVDGYRVGYYEDTDDVGRPVRAASVSTSHWYGRLGLWLFEWAFLGACAALPSITWYAANRAVDEAIRKGSLRVHEQGAATVWEDEPWYVTEEEAIHAHAIRAKKPDNQGE
jgi:hypothetical protein